MLHSESLNKIRKNRKYKGIWKRIVSVLACAVVFCTTYALLLPAITLEQSVYCGKDEHTHNGDCYGYVLTCGTEESEEHTHDDECYEYALTCSLEEHTHDAQCYINPEEDDSSDEDDYPEITAVADSVNHIGIVSGYSTYGGFFVNDESAIMTADNTEDTGSVLSSTPVDITGYLSSAKIIIDGSEYTGGTIQASNGFTADLTFSTIPGKTGSNIYTYTLPEGITVPQDIQDGVMKDSQGNTLGTYTVVNDVVTVTLNETYVQSSDYLNINLNIDAQWDLSTDGDHEVDFGNNHVTKITVTGAARLSIDKSHSTVAGRLATYSVSVHATTPQTNVVLSDTVSGNTLTYNKSDGTEATLDSKAVLQVGGTIAATKTDSSGNTTTLGSVTIDSTTTLEAFLTGLSNNLNLDAGDTLTVTYPMEYPVASTILADATEQNLRTDNTASVYSTEVPNTLTASEIWTYEGKKEHVITKNAEKQDDSVRWNLTINDGAAIPMAGTTIYDALQSDSLAYDTNQPFVVEVYTANNTLVRTDSITDWANNTDGLKLTASGRGWEYTIPESDGENQYIYKIYYYTNINGDGAALTNSAGARFTQYPGVFGDGGIGTGEVTTDARPIDIEINKNGTIIDADQCITEWTLQYIVNPGSGEIKNFRILDSLPGYTVNGSTVYAKLVGNDGTVYGPNNGDTPVDTSADENSDIFTITISRYNPDATKMTEPDYTTEAFTALKNYIGYYYKSGSEEWFAITTDDDNTRFTLPAAVGDYADGYVVTIVYRTKSDGIEPGTTLLNKMGVNYTDLKGTEQWMTTEASVKFPITDLTDSVTMDKTGYYSTDDNLVYYTVTLDEKNVGYEGAKTVTLTDEFDSRLSWEQGKYYVTATVGTNNLKWPVYTEVQSDAYYICEQVDNPDGITSGITWKTTYPQLDIRTEDENGNIVKVENPYILTTVDNANHIFTVTFPYVYMWPPNDSSNTYYPITWKVDYALTPTGDKLEYNDVYNTVTATGDNGTQYGHAERTFSFAKQLTKKTVTDYVGHSHNYNGCYTLNMTGDNDGWDLSCPLEEGDKNTLLFKIQVDFSSTALENLTEIVVDDYMDSSAMTVDMSKVQVRFVTSGDNMVYARYFKDMWEAAGVIKDAKYTTELTNNGLTVTVDFGNKEDGTPITIKNFCDACNDGVWKNYTTDFNIYDWKLEISYPATVKGNEGDTVKVTNSANLRGQEHSTDSVTYDKVIESSGGSVSNQSYTVNIKKIDAISTGGTVTALSGAEFSICDENGSVLASGTTGSNGTLAFGTQGAEGAGKCDLKPYTAYYLVETAAPEGYVTDTEKHWFYFAAPTGSDAAKAFTEDEKKQLEALGCTVMAMDGEMQLFNSKTTSVEIRKTDLNDGALLTGATFSLYDDADCQTLNQNAHTGGDGVYVLSGLVPGKTYYLKETEAPTGYSRDEKVYTVTVANDGTVTIGDLNIDTDTQDYVFPNDKQRPALPNSGGVGILPFIAGGIPLMAAGLIFGGRLRRKRGRGTG